MDCHKIKLHHINDKFCYAKLEDVSILVMKDNNYINISKLCKLENKKYKDWECMESSKKVIEKIEKDYNVPIMIRVKGRKISGCYVCIELVHHVTRWISPYIASKVPILFRYYMKEFNNVTGVCNDVLSNKNIIFGEILEILNSKYKKDMKFLNIVYEKYRTIICWELDDIKLKSKKLRTQYQEELSKNLMTDLLKNKYQMDVSYFRSKLIELKTKLDDNERNLISDSNNLRRKHVSDLEKIQTYLSSKEDYSTIIDLVTELIAYRIVDGYREAEK
nr:CPPV218 N1R/p28-like protein [Cooks petrelpox virus]